MERFRIWAAIGLGVFLALFAMQNMAPVEITILFWTFESRRIVVITLSCLVGFAIGWIMKSRKRST